MAAVAQAFHAAVTAHERMAASGAPAVLDAVDAIKGALADGHTLLVFGNGGSAADAQHFAAELVGRYVKERRGLSAVALSTDTSILTAVGHDYGFDHVFERQVEALGRPGDVAFGISTSGNSENVVRALEAARTHGLMTIALTGRDGGAAGRAAAIHVNVPEEVTARIQEVHTTVLHVMCELIDEDVETKDPPEDRDADQRQARRA